MISVEKINDFVMKKTNERNFYDEDDSVGGRDGYYKPTYNCPKDDYLWYQVNLNINPDIKEWNGYISFQHRRGDANRAYVRRKLNIKNTNLKEK